MKAVALQSGTRRGQTAATNQAAAAAIRAAEEKAYKKLYGDLLPDVELLRSRDYVVTVEKGGIRVGNAMKTRDEVKAMAARERRLGGAVGGVRSVKVTASGLKIGQAVSVAKKSAPVKGTPLSTTKSGLGAVPAERKLSGAAATAKARAAEHSTDLGTRPQVVWLDLGLLTVDRRYQREISSAGNAHINRILRAFNWNRYQPIVVTEGADGTYAVIDGQHRLEAAKKHPLIDSLPCYIIDAPDMAVQAEIFVSVNSDRRALTNLQKFWASVAAGNGEAQALVKVCEEASVTIPRTTPQGGLSPRTLIGPNIALRLVGKFGRPAVVDAIKLLAAAWPEARTAFRTSNFGALTAIASTPFNRTRLLAVLKRLDPERLYADALASAGTQSTGSLTAATEKLIRKAMQGGAR